MYGGCKDKQDPMRQRDLTEKCPRFIQTPSFYELEDRVAQRQSRLKQLQVRWPLLSDAVFRGSLSAQHLSKEEVWHSG